MFLLLFPLLPAAVIVVVLRNHPVALTRFGLACVVLGYAAFGVSLVLANRLSMAFGLLFWGMILVVLGWLLVLGGAGAALRRGVDNPLGLRSGFSPYRNGG